MDRGTKITVELKEGASQFSDKKVLESMNIIYSSLLSFYFFFLSTLDKHTLTRKQISSRSIPTSLGSLSM